MKFRLQSNTVTVPKGFIADGLGFEYHDFSKRPAWIAFEWCYATHRFDNKVADRTIIDTFLFNAYPDEIQIVDDELIYANTRISGEDCYDEAHTRGYAECEEIVTDQKSVFGSRETSSVIVGSIVAIGCCVAGLFVAQAII